ncbi:MAG: hypothetical protein KAV80_04240, partial [Methanomicrobia archaeon]|nr:hypothetical protein [Methanomicrobia archaeon]
MKKIFIKKFVEIALITLLFLGCVTETPPATTPSPTTQPPTQFEIIDLRVVPENPTVGDTLTILVDVQNKEDTSGSYTVLVTIGSKSKTQNVELEGKSSKTVEFQDTADTEGDIEIKAGDLTKTINVLPSETSTTTPPPTAPPTTTLAPTTTPPPTESKGEKIERPDYEMGTRLNYLFTVRGDEWGCTIAYNSPYEGDRTPWFRWGVTDFWETNPKETYWRGDYTYVYDRNWDLEEIVSDKVGGTKFSDDVYQCDYGSRLPCVFPLVKGTEKIDTGRFYLYISSYIIRVPGNYTSSPLSSATGTGT